MSSRALQMVQLARMLAERGEAKENVRGFKNGTFQGEHFFSKYARVDDTGKELVKKLRKKLEIDINFQHLEKPDEMQVQINSNSEIDMDGMPNFEPSVLRETQSSLNGINFDVDYLRCKKICGKSQHIENIQNDSEIESVCDNPEWMDSDDTFNDPNFNLSSKSGNSSSQSDEELIVMGAQIEKALESPKIKNKKKLRVKQRNSGKMYESVNGKTVKARSVKKFDNCRNRCSEKIDHGNVELLFNQYWSLGSYDQRILYISSLITIGDKKCDTLVNDVNRKRKREHSMKYSLPVNGINVYTCKKHFLQCFDETESFVKNVIQKKIGSPAIPFQNMRGKHTPANKCSTAQEEEIRRHISKFPAYESHYSRRDTCQKYLANSINLTSMHRLYSQETEKPVSLSKYTQIFKTMGLKFKAPNIDTCSTCDAYVSKIKVAENEDVETQLIEQKKNHLSKADMAYEAKRLDKIEARKSKCLKTFAFDLQQCLPTPFLRNSISFYKRQLWTFNLTIHDLETNAAKCFMWHEGTARRGGNEISSCLYKLLATIPEETKKIIFYSDSCSGQNKNSFVAAMFILFLSNSENIEHIDHKFLEPGHTHMECDSDHALIERKKKKSNVKIEIPRDWYQLVNSVGPKMQAFEMKVEDFFDFSKLSKSKFSWKRISEDGSKFSWNAVRWLRYTKSCTEVSFKYSLDEDEPFKVLKIGKRGAGVLNVSQISNVMDLPCISNEKKKDLMDLKQYIHPDFHYFYNNLKCSIDEPNIHPDLTESDLLDES